MDSSLVQFDTTDIDPQTLAIGEAVGILVVGTNVDAAPDVNVAWFEDPLAHLHELTQSAEGRTRLFALLESLMGGPAAGEMAQPGWYPINVPDFSAVESDGAANGDGSDDENEEPPATKSSGLYIVADPQGTLAGLGVKRDIAATDSVSCHIFAHLPLLDMAQGTIVLGDTEPVEVGMELTATDGGSFGSGDTTFDALKVDLKLHFSTAMPDLDIALKNPKLAGKPLPGAEAGADSGYVSLLKVASQAPQHVQDWINVALDLLTKRFQHSSADEATQAAVGAIGTNLRVLLGIEPWGKLPPLDWEEVVAHGPSVFRDWLLAVAADGDTLKCWMHALASLVHGEPLPPTDAGNWQVDGDGSRGDPYSVPLRHSDDGLSFEVTAALEGSNLTPGIRLESKCFEPTAGLGLRFSARAEAVTFDLDAVRSVALFPHFSAIVTALNPEDQNSPLVAFTDLGDAANDFEVDSVTVGIAFETESTEFDPIFAFAGNLENYSSGFDFEQIVADKGAPLIQLVASLLVAYDEYQSSEDTPIDPRFDADNPFEMEQRIELFARYLSIAAILVGAQSNDEIPDRMAQLFEQHTDLLDNPGKIPGTLLHGLRQLFDEDRLVEALSGVEGVVPDDSGKAITLSPTMGLDLHIGIDEASERFGLTVHPHVDASWLNAMVLVGIGIDATGDDLAPRFTLETHVGMDDAWLHHLQAPALGSGPELVGRLEGGGFSLAFYPAGQEQFVCMLLPSPPQTPCLCYVDAPSESVPADEWLLAFCGRVLLPMVADYILAIDAVKSQLEIDLLTALSINDSLTIGRLLVDVGLLIQTDADQAYDMPDPEALSAIEFSELPAKICAAVLQPILVQDEIALYHGKKTAGGSQGAGADGIYLHRQGALYGLRIKFADMKLSKATKDRSDDPSKSGASKHSPSLILQLGKWLGDEDHDKNWLSSAGGHQADPGIILNLLQIDERGPQFAPKLTMVSVGFDFGRSGDAPLFKSHGYQVAAIQPRFYLQVGDGFEFGAAIRADEIGIPLGPKVDDSGGAHNPVAQNLLASGSPKSGDEKEAVNPTFSATVAYAGRFHGEIHQDPPSLEPIIWLPIDRQFGPLYCKRVGLGFADGSSTEAGPNLLVGYDGRVALGPLSITLIDLEVGVPLKHPGDFDEYSLALGGLDVDMNSASVEISGGLLKRTDPTDGRLTYDGELILKYQEYSLNAVGSYGVMAGHPSFFVFAMVTGPIGGPGFFYVTGIAAGFGYNRGLVIPTEAKDAESFPLLGVMSAPNNPSASEEKAPTPAGMLDKLGPAAPPQRGEYWLAAGVQFTSYEVIQSKALLVVKFGQDFEIDILGLSRAELPMTGTPYVYAELALLATFNPGQGLLMVKGSLTENSYLIDHECKLTGGFAFMAWFDPNLHAGDFVVTIGGYHPAFKAPDHYPVVDRLGFVWHYSDQITVTGEAYFAITPTAAMAGGRLEVDFHSGDLRAGLIAHADMIIFWKPFFIEVSVGIEINISFHMDLLFCSVTLHVSLSVELDFWGPPTGGVVTVDWSIISFDVGFGAAKAIDTNAALPWHEFKTLLPPAGTENETADQKPMPVAQPPRPAAAMQSFAFESSVELEPLSVAEASVTPTPSADATSEPAVLSISADAGVVVTTVDGRWLVRPRLFSFSVQTTIPVTTLSMGTIYVDNGVGPPLAIRPMGIAALDSQMTVTITRDSDGVDEDFSSWIYTPLRRNLPSAMWGQPAKREGLPKTVEVIKNCLVGISRVQHRNIHPVVGTDEFDAKRLFTYRYLETVIAYPQAKDAVTRGKAYYHPFLALNERAVEPQTDGPTTAQDYSELKQINSDDVVKQRRQLFDAINGLGSRPGINGSMAHMAENPIGDLFGLPFISA